MIRSKVLVAALSVMLAGPATAGEFGNVFGEGGIDKNSRDASATALAGIELIMAALRIRELQGGDGAQQFEAAASLLREASAKMNSLLRSFPDVPLDQGAVAQLRAQFDQSASISRDLESVTKLSDVYRLFALRTEQLAESLGKMSGQENAFRELSPMLTEYFRLADAVVALRDTR